MIIGGYILAFTVLFSVIGIIIGCNLLSKKVLPNGEKVRVYTDKDRMHGKIILAISIIIFCEIAKECIIFSIERINN